MGKKLWSNSVLARKLGPISLRVFFTTGLIFAILLLSTCVPQLPEAGLPTEEWQPTVALYYPYSSAIYITIPEANFSNYGYYIDYEQTQRVDFTTIITIASHQIEFLAFTDEVIKFAISPPLDPSNPSDLVVSFDTTTVFYKHVVTELSDVIASKCQFAIPSIDITLHE